MIGGPKEGVQDGKMAAKARVSTMEGRKRKGIEDGRKASIMRRP